MSNQNELSVILGAGACLLDSPSTPQNDLKSALLSRLDKFYGELNLPSKSDCLSSLDAVQLKTADEALYVVERVQALINTDDFSPEAPLIGTRDLNVLRTLLSITFRWGVEPLLTRIISAWPSTSINIVNEQKIIDLTSTPDDYLHLSDLITRLLALVFPGGPHRGLSSTLITEVVLQRHITDLLKPSIGLGWLPKSLTTDMMLPLDNVRPLIMRLLAILPPSEAIVALGGVVSSVTSIPHVRRTCGYLMSRQLLRPEGVRGLCAAVCGESEGLDDVQLDKLQHVSRILSTTPSGTKPEEYFSTVIPRIMNLLLDNNHPAYKRAAAFSLSQMLATEGSPASIVVVQFLHGPFLRVASSVPDNETTATIALNTLTVLITNSDPSPTLIQSLLSPIIPPLYALLFHLDSTKTSDPELKETVQGLLLTWSRVVSTSEALDTLWSVFDDEGCKWQSSLEGEIRRVDVSESPVGISLFTPESLKHANRSGELDPDANVLDLYPDPRHFAALLKSIHRDDILSGFFVRLLAAYQESRQETENETNPLRTLLYLQMIIQMQTAMSDGTAPSGLLSNPGQILAFIKYALETTAERTPVVNHKKQDPGVEVIHIGNLKLVDTLGDDSLSDEDSDDDLPDSETYTTSDEMTETIVNLLLSVLEANEDLSARTEPVLNEIFSLLEPCALNGPTAIRVVAREARMVMTARLATGSSTSKTRKYASGDDGWRDIYQRALKLLQDPILPVRAHGLLLLRQLVSPQSLESREVDPALVPAIQDIFLQSIQDDDSYIFLNAVQGLAALVDRFGDGVLKGLLCEYTRGLTGLETGNMTQQDVDTRIRIGEALALVIRRCGEMLGAYGNLIVPPLLHTVRSTHVPTALRTSALSLLADCQNTQPLALLPYLVDLSEGMVDLLQVEAVTSKDSGSEFTEKVTPTMDDYPSSLNSKFPALRRAALHFLSLLIRGTTAQIYQSSYGVSFLSSDLLRRMRVTLSYVSGTDVDIRVRVMAREALEDMSHLEQAKLGI